MSYTWKFQFISNSASVFANAVSLNEYETFKVFLFYIILLTGLHILKMLKDL